MEKQIAQNYATHRRMYPIQHYVLAPIGIITFIISVFYTIEALSNQPFSWLPVLVLSLAFQVLLVGFIARRNGLVAQDRAIRAEEQLRHYVLTNQRLDSRLSIHQIVALRFASDEQFPALASQAADQGMKTNEIKKAIRQWRPDHHRV